MTDSDTAQEEEERERKKRGKVLKEEGFPKPVQCVTELFISINSKKQPTLKRDSEGGSG